MGTGEFGGLILAWVHEETFNAALLTCIGLGVALLAASACWMSERKKRKAIEQQFPEIMSEMNARRLNDERNTVMFEGQRQLNELMAAKLSAEIRILEAQLDTMKNHPDREEAGKEAHELMVEKTRLEIDGLRLHNAEARRRADDWRGE